MRPTGPDRELQFRALFADAYPDVLRFVQRRAHPSHAEDVAAEALLVAWRRFDDAPSGFDERRAWLFGIARNCLLNAKRGTRRRAALAVRIATTAPGSYGGPDDDLSAHRLDLGAAWERLSTPQQEVLALTIFDDLASPQAAQVLGITPTSYRLRLHRARRALRLQLDPRLAFPDRTEALT